MALRWAGHSASSAWRAPWPDGGRTRQSANAPVRSIVRSMCECEWSAMTIIACSSRNASAPPPASITRHSSASAAAIDWICACGPFLCECASLSGSDSSMKSKRSCSTRWEPTQPACWSRMPGIPIRDQQVVLRLAKMSA